VVLFWVAILAISVLLYVLLDGFDLGVGMLVGRAGDESQRRVMLSTVAPLWDGNETWLIVAGVVLWGAFPMVYAALLSAFYLPLLIMLAGLILRGVAFEFRAKAERLRWIWDLSFSSGSLVAAFMQGVTVGALVEGIPIANGEYSGGDFTWLSPFAILCGVGLCLGYSLLGACWLVKKWSLPKQTADFISLGACGNVRQALLDAADFLTFGKSERRQKASVKERQMTIAKKLKEQQGHKLMETIKSIEKAAATGMKVYRTAEPMVKAVIKNWGRIK